VNLVVTPLLMWLTISGFVSLWCFWAAIASIVIAFHLATVLGRATLVEMSAPSRLPGRRAFAVNRRGFRQVAVRRVEQLGRA